MNESCVISFKRDTLIGYIKRVEWVRQPIVLNLNYSVRREDMLHIVTRLIPVQLILHYTFTNYSAPFLLAPLEMSLLIIVCAISANVSDPFPDL